MRVKITLLGGLLFLFSCNDILDIEPQDAVSDAAVWSDPALLELYVNSRYGALPHGYVQWAGGLRVSGLTDESFHMHQPQHLNKYTEGGLNPVNMHLFGGFWVQAYSEIRNLNLFLENANPAVGDAERINQLIAEVRFLRSWYYLELFARYGDVPLITTTVGIEEASQIEERAPVAEVVGFITAELTEAADVLPEVQNGDDFGRVTKGAAFAFKARSLLYAASPLFGGVATWQEVADACEELFALGIYALSNDYESMFLNPFDAENIFFKQFFSVQQPEANFELGYYMPSGGHNIEEWRLPNGNAGWSGENPLMNLVNQFETLEGEIPVLGYTGQSDDLTPIINPSATSYDPENPYENRDPRLSYSVVFDGSMLNGREVQFWECGSDSRCDEVAFNWNGAELDHTIRKGLDLTWEPSPGINSPTPFVYMRLAEVYLTYAEANYHLGNTGIAQDYVNRVRARVGMPSIESSQSGVDLLSKIKHERQVELAFEGNRWYDVRRWMDAEEYFAEDAVGLEVMRDEVTGSKSYRYFVQQVRSFPQSHYLFPIPFEELSKTNWQQNPGY